MKSPMIIVAVLIALGAAESAPGPKPAFEDRFAGKLGPGWSWLREDPKAWRIEKKGLEIRVQPGDAMTVKNALVRAAPDRAKGKFAIEATVTNLSKPSNQYEQLGITWYIAGAPAFKMVRELIDGKRYVFPGKIPLDDDRVQLRVIVSADGFVGQFRVDPKGEFKTAAEGKLPPPEKDKKEEVSLQCYQGPPDAEHWMRFEDFRILELPEGPEKK